MEDYGNLQGATSAIRRLVSLGDYVSRPANPTRVLSIRWTAPENIPAGTVVSVPCPANLYDCTTWANYYSAPTYDYVGYFASSHSSTEEKKTVLAQSGSTAMQNFAFDGMDDID